MSDLRFFYKTHFHFLGPLYFPMAMDYVSTKVSKDNTKSPSGCLVEVRIIECLNCKEHPTYHVVVYLSFVSI